MMHRILIVISFTYFSSDFNKRAALALTSIVLYSFLSLYVGPYDNKKIKEFDMLSAIVQSITIVLLIYLSNNTSLAIYIFLFILILVINFIFTSYAIILISITYKDSFINKLVKLKFMNCL